MNQREKVISSLLLATCVALKMAPIQCAEFENRCRTWEDGRYCAVNFGAVLANPGEMNGRKISLDGFLVSENGEYLLFDNAEVSRRRSRADAIAIIATEREHESSVVRYSGALVRVRGVVQQDTSWMARPAALVLRTSAPVTILPLSDKGP